MRYEVRISRSAEREMDRLPAKLHTRISRRILALEETPRPRGVKKLTSRDEYSIRIGDHRVLYTIDDSKRVVVVWAVGHRGEVYR